MQFLNNLFWSQPQPQLFDTQNGRIIDTKNPYQALNGIPLIAQMMTPPNMANGRPGVRRLNITDPITGQQLPPFLGQTVVQQTITPIKQQPFVPGLLPQNQQNVNPPIATALGINPQQPGYGQLGPNGLSVHRSLVFPGLISHVPGSIADSTQRILNKRDRIHVYDPDSDTVLVNMSATPTIGPTQLVNISPLVRINGNAPASILLSPTSPFYNGAFHGGSGDVESTEQFIFDSSDEK
jgi:hypothetical protein